MAKDGRPIYRILMQEKSGAETKDGWPDTGCQAEMGFFYSKNDAVEAMHENLCNIWECVYNFGFVIEQHEGLYDCPGRDRRTFFRWDEEKKGFYEAEEPETLRNLLF